MESPLALDALPLDLEAVSVELAAEDDVPVLGVSGGDGEGGGGAGRLGAVLELVVDIGTEQVLKEIFEFDVTEEQSDSEMLAVSLN